MAAAPQQSLRLVPEDRRDPARVAGWRVRIGAVAAIVVATVAAFVLWRSSPARGVRALPPEQRRALLSRTVDELRQFCRDGRPDALADHCRELASFAAQFDECRGECETLVRPLLTPTPTR